MEYAVLAVVHRASIHYAGVGLLHHCRKVVLDIVAVEAVSVYSVLQA